MKQSRTSISISTNGSTYVLFKIQFPNYQQTGIDLIPYALHIQNVKFRPFVYPEKLHLLLINHPPTQFDTLVPLLGWKTIFKILSATQKQIYKCQPQKNYVSISEYVDKLHKHISATANAMRNWYILVPNFNYKSQWLIFSTQTYKLISLGP